MGKLKLSEIAYRRIRELISTRRFLPGDQLPEIVLSKELNMSRTPIREALHKLEDEEIVVIRPRIGAFVATIDIPQLCNLYEAREALQGMIANLCCKPGVNTQIFISLRDELLSLLKIEDTDKRHELLSGYSNHYLDVLRENCGNPLLQKMDRTISDRINAMAHVTHIIPLYPDEAGQERLEILDAIINKQSMEAEMRTRQHVRNIFNRIMDTLKRM
jgi:DNA-binding GntR family transcriptional regulator